MKLGYELDDRGFGSRSGLEIFLPHHRVQTDSGDHPAPYPTDTGGKAPGL